MKSESDVQQEIQKEGPKFGCILMRNNSGALPDANGRTVRFGLGNVSKEHQKIMRSSDLVGLTRVVITPDMVGRTVGIFTVCEVKEEAWNGKITSAREKAQDNFIQFVLANGGIAGFANSVSKFRKLFGL